MAIVLFYECADAACEFETGQLDAAQNHSNDTGHTVHISGTLSPNKIVINEQTIAAAAEKKVREAAIMRAARDRGLLKQVR